MKPDLIAHAVNLLSKGEVVGIPTETVYGLAGDITQPEAIRQIFSLKNRPLNHPLIVHIGNKDDLNLYAKNIPQEVEKLIQHFWPGPLTFLLEKQTTISDLITGNQTSVAIRMPAHPITLAIIQQLGHPIAAPSANRFGHTSPTIAEHVTEEFDKKIYVVDGGRCSMGMESTIVDVRKKNQGQIVRQGLITASDLNEVLGKEWVITNAKNTSHTPGNLPNHYAPTKPLFLFQTQAELNEINQQYQNNVYLIYISDILEKNNVLTFKMPNEALAYAYQLYYQLRLADQTNAAVIALELPPTHTEKWQAIHDKLQRAKIN